MLSFEGNKLSCKSCTEGTQKTNTAGHGKLERSLHFTHGAMDSLIYAKILETKVGFFSYLLVLFENSGSVNKVKLYGLKR
jgi:hypothetical protein